MLRMKGRLAIIVAKNSKEGQDERFETLRIVTDRPQHQYSK
jgi:hypothetical protein